MKITCIETSSTELFQRYMRKVLVSNQDCVREDYDIDSSSPTHIAASILNVNMLSPCKVCVVKVREKGKIKDALEVAGKISGRKSQNICIILFLGLTVEANVKREFENLGAEWLDLNPKKGERFREVEEVLKELKLKMKKDAFDFLELVTEGDFDRMTSEIEKLYLYRYPDTASPVTSADVKAVTGVPVNFDIFRFIDAAVFGNQKECARHILSAGEAIDEEVASKTLFLLAKSLLSAILILSGVHVENVSRELKVPAFAVKKYRAMPQQNLKRLSKMLLRVSRNYLNLRFRRIEPLDALFTLLLDNWYPDGQCPF